ncbi:MAG: hypothetical protein M4579_000310 [Chaenotheca gracillima]|nr:MAG: hypothetical protein M4579_000310 [Chaenotheca gracillima]
MATGKICITGATGGLGSRVLHHLLKTLHVPPSSIIVSLHNPAGLPSELQNIGLDIRQGDFQKPETLGPAFEGASKLLVVSYPSIARGIRVESHKNAIDAAKKAGVTHIYYTSLAFASDSSAAVMKAHQDTEAYLKQCDIKYTIMREGIYNESYPLYLGYFNAAKANADGNRKVIIPGDGGIAWVGRDDLGEGTARIMTSDSDEFTNKTLLLSGDRALTLKEVAALIGDIMGWTTPVEVDEVTPEEYIVHHSKSQDGEVVKLWSTTYPAMKRGELAKVDPLLQKLLPHKLKTMEESLREELQDVKSGSSNIQRYSK